MRAITTQRYFGAVTIGQQLTGLEVVLDARHLFAFSAATNNAHRVHYDRAWAVEREQHRDILVHGPLQAALMARALTDWAGPDGRLVEFSFSHRASAWPGERLTFTGHVVALRQSDGVGLIDIELRETNGQGEIIMPGTATVSLPVA